MKNCIVVAVLMSLGGLMLAEETELSAQMKILDAAFSTLRKPDAASGRQVVRKAEQIGVAYENMIEFWRQRKAEDAVKWSEAGKAAALQLATAMSSGDAERVAVAMKSLGGTCRSCHEAHREKLSDGRYRIKL
jgi:nitrate/TMAO reductase-like tetraheme cytochrome c subunit